MGLALQCLGKASGTGGDQHPSSEHPQEDTLPLTISWNVKMAPTSCHAWVIGWRCTSLPETLLCSAAAAAEWLWLTATWGASPEWHRIGHGALYLTVWRNFVLSISRTYCKPPDEIWSSEKLTGNSIGRFWFPNKKIRGWKTMVPIRFQGGIDCCWCSQMWFDLKEKQIFTSSF